MKRTLIVGGTGVVGRHLLSLLASRGSVLVASRSLRRAIEVADTVNGAEPIAIDTNNNEVVVPLDVGTVIDCSGTDQLSLAKATARIGADLIDISASTAHLSQLVELDPLFVEAGSRCLIGVGLAPGLSTMLGLSVHEFQAPLPILINGIMNTRDEHGPSSAAFTLGELGTYFIDPTTQRQVRHFSGLQRVSLPAGFGRRFVARADFPDQHILTNELGVPVVTNYGFTRSAATLLFAAASRIPGARSLLTRLSASLPRPTGACSWLITAMTERNNSWATGVGQAKGTAVMANLAALELVKPELIEPGVSYLHQVLKLNAKTASTLDEHGITVQCTSVNGLLTEGSG